MNPGLDNSFKELKRGSLLLAQLPSAVKRQVLLNIAEQLLFKTKELMELNQLDLQNLSAQATTAFRDRLTITPARIQAMVQSLRQVAELPDPVGETVESKILSNGLRLRRVRAPLGVIFMIFESRPNVILEAFSLAFKSGNVIALRGGSDSKWTAQFLYQLIEDELQKYNVGATMFIGINDYDRQLIADLLKRNDLIDVVVPRGGEQLIEFVTNHAQMPIIKNDRGMCHAYVDSQADLDMAVNIVANAKTQRPGVCNALETVLVHKDCAARFLPMLYQKTAAVNLSWRCDTDSIKILNNVANVSLAVDQDWNTEHLDLILNCKIVDGVEQAIAHIQTFGSKHSEAIVTDNKNTALQFQLRVDAAAVYWNASTRFTDGFEFGLGGELGISTQKLHVRGPIGLKELTCTRWLIDGTGQIRS